MRQPVVLKQNTKSAVAAYPATFAWLGLVAVYAGFLSVGFVFHFLPPILPVIIADLGLSHTQAGLLMSLFALPGILLSLPGGWLVDRYGERLVGGLGVTLMGAGTLLLAMAPTFTLVLLARVLSGIGAMVGVVALQRLVVRLFAGRSLGLPLGISGSAVPVGIIIVLNIAGPLAESEGWRVVALRVGGVTALIGLAFVAVVTVVTRGRELGRNQNEDVETLPDQAQKFRPLWIGGAVWFCANGAMTAFMTFAPDHFQGLGFDVSARGLFTSIPMWTSAALGMVTGWLTDRHGGRPAFMAVGLLMMGVALIILPTLLVPPALVGLVLGLSLAAVVTPTIALPGVLLPASHTGRGYGILATCANVGIFVVPPLAGMLRDISGGYLWPFFLMGGVALLGVMAAETLRRGKFMPGFSRHALALVALVLVVGCGKQDRYEVVAPDIFVAGVVQEGEITAVHAMLSGNGLEAADAWSENDLVEVGMYGRVLRIQGDLYIPLNFPGREHLVGVLCEPDEELLVVTDGGAFWRWSGGTWMQLPAVPVNRARFLVRDHLGFPLSGGSAESEALYRFESGVWTMIGGTVEPRIRLAWSHPAQGTWLVTYENEILTLNGNRAAVVDSAGVNDYYGSPQLVGDGVDKLVYCEGGREMWLSVGGVGTIHTWLASVEPRVLFWRDGLLHCVTSGYELAAWDGADWLTIPDTAVSGHSVLSRSRSGKELIFDTDGGVDVYDGATTREAVPRQGGVDGLQEYQGRLMAYLDRGTLFRAESNPPEAWRLIARTENRARDNSLINALIVDDLGRLLVKDLYNLWHWDGTALVREEIVGLVLRADTMPDGEVLISTDESVVALSQGELEYSPTWDFYDDSIRGLRRRSATEIEVLSTEGMYLLSGGNELELQWVFMGWRPAALVVLDEDWAVIMGSGNTRELVDGRWQDMGPFVRSGSAAMTPTMSDFCELADGRLLGWSSGLHALVVRDGGFWQVIEPLQSPGESWMRSIGSAVFIKTENHGLMLMDSDDILKVDLSGGAP